MQVETRGSQDGAYGHTGRFVVAELRRRGIEPVVSGRDATRLAATGYEARPAATDDPAALAAAFAGADVVINVAGPFLDTAVPVAAAAVRAGAHYLDVSAEQAPSAPWLRSWARRRARRG
ncbi:saccharopine dehydrogenase NADP-binding domain-containing protein [Pseudonocardia oroxyli]|uniref:Saccharopine dehydrogenase NADP binding domain-containing protein n=1 Tax=Pseudonocardia oroxyli TaxID=366584 RepID=A0A1G7TWG7_PSEOR|nr:saccharopine dehydrogenase NADP-binding domain-containing protein [Pseudonocardia oroxyli]SDG39451.1 Saccharopine dehydrogenase NADP binding domain-containing protein [Pseudonocardia oroxyli]